MSGSLQGLLASFQSGPPVGQQAYTTPGTYTWVAPAGVTSVCVVCVGPGAGRFAGGLGWKNNISVTPGNSYTVSVGNGSGAPQNSYFINLSTVVGYNYDGAIGSKGGGSYLGDGGGSGAGLGSYTAGGGAGGYTGDGGYGALGAITTNGSAGSGGGGGGGGATGNSSGDYYNPPYYEETFAGGGGGVGLLGQGANGAGGTYSGTNSAGGGGGGSSGTAGGSRTGSAGGGNGGNYGGAAGLGWIEYNNGGGDEGYQQISGTPGSGAVRIIWGTGRSFPSTNTGNV